MSKEYEIQWGSAPDFAEVAETLKVRTNQIMHLTVDGGKYIVAYTPDDDTLIYSTTLMRNEDAILYRINEPTPHPGMWEEMTEQIEKKLREKYGRDDE